MATTTEFETTTGSVGAVKGALDLARAYEVERELLLREGVDLWYQHEIAEMRRHNPHLLEALTRLAHQLGWQHDLDFAQQRRDGQPITGEAAAALVGGAVAHRMLRLTFADTDLPVVDPILVEQHEATADPWWASLPEGLNAEHFVDAVSVPSDFLGTGHGARFVVGAVMRADPTAGVSQYLFDTPTN